MINPQLSSHKQQSALRLGIFGGSFDPVHRGHLALADSCRQQAELDTVWFVPNARQPLKPQGPVASDEYRLDMLRLVCEEGARFELSEIELDRGGVSYTVDTLQAIHDAKPNAELFFLLGADSLSDLPLWHRPDEICRLANLLVVRRSGSPEPDFDGLSSIVSSDQLAKIRQNQVNMPEMPISSSEIRQQIALGGEWQKFVPPIVADYIKQHNLYTNE